MTQLEFEIEEQNESLPYEEQDLRILKNILTSPQSLQQFSMIGGHKFLKGSARELGDLVVAYYEKFKTIPTQRILFEKIDGDFDLKSKIEFLLQEVQETDASPEEFRYDLHKIKNRFIESKRQILNSIITSDSDQWVSHLKSEIEQIDLLRHARKQTAVRKNLRDYVQIFKSDYAQKLLNPEYKQGILTGYSCLDYICNGLYPAEMLIIAGESGAGKSLWLNNMAKQMWLQKNGIHSSSFSRGYNIQYFSLEMPFEACFRRTVASLSEVPLYGLRDSTLLKHQLEKVDTAFDFITSYPQVFEIVDITRGCTVDHIEAKFLESCDDHPIDVVVVDYLGLLDQPGFQGDDWLKLAHIAGRLHEFARTYNIVVLTAVQLNRVDPAKLKNPGDAIGLHRIGRSSGIVHHANIALQIETRQNEKAYPDFPYHIIKNRDGELASHQLIKNFQCASLKEPEFPFQPENNPMLGSGENWDTDSEDMSAILQKIGWN